MNHKIQISGMSCGHCVSSVKSIIAELEGIESINVSLETSSADVSSSSVSKETIIAHVNKTEIYKAS